MRIIKAPKHNFQPQLHISILITLLPSLLGAKLTSGIDIMKDLVFTDITVELATRDDCFLSDVKHLLLELKSDSQVVARIGLLSREATRGVWAVDQVFAL